MFATALVLDCSCTFVKVTPGAVVVIVTMPPTAWSFAKPVPVMPTEADVYEKPWPAIARLLVGHENEKKLMHVSVGAVAAPAVLAIATGNAAATRTAPTATVFAMY